MILKLETLERKSEARAAYGFRDWSVLGMFFERVVPRFPLLVWTPPFLAWTPFESFVSGTRTISLFSAGKASQLGHIFEDDCIQGRGVDYGLQFFLGDRLIMYVFY